MHQMNSDKRKNRFSQLPHLQVAPEPHKVVVKIDFVPYIYSVHIFSYICVQYVCSYLKCASHFNKTTMAIFEQIAWVLLLSSFFFSICPSLPFGDENCPYYYHHKNSICISFFLLLYTTSMNAPEMLIRIT